MYENQQQAPNGLHQPFEVIRSSATSPLFLTAIIAYSVNILLQLLTSSSPSSSWIAKILDQAMAENGAYDYMYYLDTFNTISTVRTTMAIASALPGILIAIGLWLIFSAAYNQNNWKNGLTGLKIIHVILIICMIGCIAFLAVLVISCLIAMVALSDEAGLVAIFLITGIIIAAIGFIPIFFYKKCMDAIKTAKEIFMFNRLGEPISMFIPVICFIMGAMDLLAIFGNVLTALASATASIAFGIFIISFKDKMEILRRGGTIPTAPQGNMNQQNQQWNNVQQQNPQNQQGQQNQQDQWNQQQNQQEQQNQQDQQQNQKPSQWTRAEPKSQPVVTPVQQGQRPGTTVLTNDPGAPNTVVLNENDASMPMATLIRRKDHSVIAINKQAFCIGSYGANLDYCIQDNPAISRHHADILYGNGTFTIVDRDSTNHVYLNGQRIDSGRAYELRNGMNIRLANEDFDFRV